MSFLGDFGNPYLPRGGASVSVLFGVAPGIDRADFINQYINPVNAGVAALHVANVDNIQVQGKTTGIPVVASVDTGALTAASAATSAVTQMAQNLVRTHAAGVPQRHWIITVQVEGFGDSNDDSGGGSDARKKHKPSPVSYNPASEVTLLGFGGVGKTQRAFLTEEERSKLGGI